MNFVWREEESALQKGNRICKRPGVRRSKARSRCMNRMAGTKSGKVEAIGWEGPNVQNPYKQGDAIEGFPGGDGYDHRSCRCSQVLTGRFSG